MTIKKRNALQQLFLSSSMMVVLSACQSTVEDVSEKYALAYGGIEQNQKAIFLTDENGLSRVKIADLTKLDGYPAVSPNGKQVLFYGKYDNRKTWSIHVGDIDGKNIKRLTHTKHVWDSAPAWSADGKTVIFAREFRGSDGKADEQIWLMNPDGSNKRHLTALKGRSPELMPDGRVLFQSITGPSQISIAQPDGSNLITLTSDDTNNMSPKLSPNGKQIAYLSNRDGNQEVYVMNVDGTNHQRLTKNSIQEWDPAWSPDGKKVFFSSQSTHGFYDIYKVNADGSNMTKVIQGGSQAATVFKVDKTLLH